MGASLRGPESCSTCGCGPGCPAPTERHEPIQAIAHARRGKATPAIAKIDRLSRNAAFLASLRESEVDSVAGDQPDANRLTVHILAAVAEDEARGGVLVTNDLTPGGRARAAKAGTPAVREKARAEYGDAAPPVLRPRAGGMTRQAIADRPNAGGHTIRTGRAWGQVQVERALDQADA